MIHDLFISVYIFSRILTQPVGDVKIENIRAIETPKGYVKNIYNSSDVASNQGSQQPRGIVVNFN